mmetsp:Transcript_81400/g.226725  ORF Transcript_81400/g.226725 Transcript_81400/m.226725 type:complete len:324 (+) Transcript_81400:80-1051(+)
MASLGIGCAMESFPRDEIPGEVRAALRGAGLPEVVKCSLIKVSFHATYIVELAAPPAKVVVQLLGSQIGDKAIFRPDRPISAGSIERASSLAREAGIRVPDVLATGLVEEWGCLRDLPFVAYEFIETETVEDEVTAPGEELHRVIGDICQAFGARPLTDVDTEPVQRFESVAEFIAQLKALAAEAEAAELSSALDELSAEFEGIEPKAPVLIHQDLNDGNVLCSRNPDGSGSWRLDALIDWEGAAVADPRLAWERGEPWASLRLVSKAVRCRWLTTAAAKGGAASAALPRCQLEELCEDYDEFGEQLVRAKRVSKLEALPKWL